MTARLPLVRTWRGNYRANLQLVNRAVIQAFELGLRRPLGSPRYLYTPSGQLIPTVDAMAALQNWVADALAQQSTPQVHTGLGGSLSLPVISAGSPQGEVPQVAPVVTVSGETFHEPRTI